MPMKPMTLRPRRTMGAVFAVRTAKREFEQRRRDRSPWRALYKTSRWQSIRRHQLAIEPLCRMCVARGIVREARVCDHVEPHRGDPDKFFAGPFQSLCKPCHDGDKQREEWSGEHTDDADGQL
ncbi:hypothetical protein SAMN05519104_6682 [Rhizobiales bacterium GAS188]|nr:hypothetical protein SAMN05519104_6682 [Rhizobiales bacterium GAS188]